MENTEWLAVQFEANRTHMQGVAFRMLGSLSEADDAVQAAWLRLSSADTNSIENLGGWLTTVVARVCLDMLRSRQSRHEEPLDPQAPEPIASPQQGSDPEREALLAESVGLALLVVLNTLSPEERLAFVLHDIFDVSFDEIAPIVKRTPSTARKLVSRARHRVRGTTSVPSAELTRQREAVEAFLAASHAGDFDALLLLLDPAVEFRAEGVIVPSGETWAIHGAQGVARQFGRRGSTLGAQSALINGAVGIVVAPAGRLLRVMRLTFAEGKIAAIHATANPVDMSLLDLAVLGDWQASVKG